MVAPSTGISMFALLLVSTVASPATTPEEVSPEAWAADDGACHSSSGEKGEECGLSLRQLRVRELQSPQALADSLSPKEVGWPEGLAIPGGWGEGAEFVDSMKEHELANETNGTEHLESQASWWGISCARYGCQGHYIPWLACQCNPSCQKHGSCCWDYTTRCGYHHSPARRRHGKRNVMTLYHQTGRSIGPLILANGFRPGRSGWCGGGIYFATSAEATNTKAIGPDSHKGFMIQAVVDVGHVKHMSKTCDRGMSRGKLASMGYDSITFNPGDGPEYVVYSSSRVLSTRQVGL